MVNLKEKNWIRKSCSNVINSKTMQNQHKKYMHLCGSSFCCEYKCVFPKNSSVLFYKGSMYSRLLNM